MKNKFIFSFLMVIALASGCIKEEGEILTICRNVNDNPKDKDTIPHTIVTSANGFMYGETPMDSIVKNYFEMNINENSKILELDCYITLFSEYKNLNLERNAIQEVGYVYSHTNKQPVLSDHNECQYCKLKDAADSTKEEFSFKGTIHKLNFHYKYFLRSYLISCQGDTMYNPRVVEVETVLPEDVWFRRNDAPNSLVGRTEAFTITNGDKTYLYGGRSGSQYFNDMWVYDKKNDTWQQLSTFEDGSSYYSGTAKRANGAIFPYAKGGIDTLLYIAGGLIGDNKPTAQVFYYSIGHNRFANSNDHPNKGKVYDLYNSKHQPIYDTIYPDPNDKTVYNLPEQPKKGDCSRAWVEPLPLYAGTTLKGLYGCVGFVLPDNVKDEGFRAFVGYGRTDLSTVDGVSTTIYVYDLYYDRTCNAPGEDSQMAWTALSTGDKRNVNGFYQPVCVKCDDRVVIGSGESVKANNQPSKAFYTISWDDEIQNIELTEMPAPPSEFKVRANAAGFYLKYQKNGTSYDRMFVGTGRSCAEKDFKGTIDQLLNDLWCYDFTSKEWTRKADCSNIYRQGASGFSVMRNDDDYYNTFGENIRGYFSFGEGMVYDAQLEQFDYSYGLHDNWEYLP